MIVLLCYLNKHRKAHRFSFFSRALAQHLNVITKGIIIGKIPTT